MQPRRTGLDPQMSYLYSPKSLTPVYTLNQSWTSCRGNHWSNHCSGFPPGVLIKSRFLVYSWVHQPCAWRNSGHGYVEGKGTREEGCACKIEKQKQDTGPLNTQFKDLLKYDLRKVMILKIFLPRKRFWFSWLFFILGLPDFLTEYFK